MTFGIRHLSVASCTRQISLNPSAGPSQLRPELYSVLVNPLPFEIIFTNQGDGFNGSSVVIPQAGVYYIYFSAGIYYNKGKMELMVNGVTTVNVHHESTSLTTNARTLSRAIILRLKLNDELHFQIPAGYILGSGCYRLAIFSGFKIYD